MIFRNTKLILVVLSLLLTVVMATAIFVIYDIRFKNQDASRLQSEADQIARARSLSQSIRLAQNNAKTDLADFNNLLLSSDKLVFLIEDVEKAGRGLQLETNIISVGKVADTESTKSNMISITIETQGSWAPTLSFLRAIESLPYRVMINESGLSKVDTGLASGVASWHLRITLSLYSFD